MDLVAETNQSLGLAPTESVAQVTPTSPEILVAEIPEERRRGATAGAVGDWALLPIIVVVQIRFHHSTITVSGRMKLTASKMSRLALLAPIVGRGFPVKGGRCWCRHRQLQEWQS